jgi:hypothetical protein
LDDVREETGYRKLKAYKEREDEEEGGSSYWMTSGKRQDTGS